MMLLPNARTHSSGELVRRVQSKKIKEKKMLTFSKCCDILKSFKMKWLVAPSCWARTLEIEGMHVDKIDVRVDFQLHKIEQSDKLLLNGCAIKIPWELCFWPSFSYCYLKFFKFHASGVVSWNKEMETAASLFFMNIFIAFNKHFTINHETLNLNYITWLCFISFPSEFIWWSAYILTK